VREHARRSIAYPNGTSAGREFSLVDGFYNDSDGSSSGDEDTTDYRYFYMQQALVTATLTSADDNVILPIRRHIKPYTMDKAMSDWAKGSPLTDEPKSEMSYGKQFINILNGYRRTHSSGPTSSSGTWE
jgi:hypothetical protein